MVQPQTERELLITISADVAVLKTAILGNGREGLLERMAATEVRLDKQEADSPGPKTQAATKAGGLSGLLALLIITVPEILKNLPVTLGLK